MVLVSLDRQLVLLHSLLDQKSVKRDPLQQPWSLELSLQILESEFSTLCCIDLVCLMT
jgi:hypothetical protein